MIQKQRRHRKRGQHSLYSAPENCRYTVTAVPDVKILNSLGFYPGTVVHKEKRFRMGGPVLIRRATREIALGKDIASAILVEEDNTL
ncbi:MAG TPA: ferrous iron transport protein A [Firmicutes bacterium]|nr:ferrous iron transport protein A [Bacillota bacterium]